MTPPHRGAHPGAPSEPRAAVLAAPASPTTTPTLPTDWYLDSDIWQLERDRIFDVSWQYAGHRDRLRRPGDYLCTRLGDVPVVVTCDRSGALNGLINVCRHRLHEVVAGEGNRRTLQCPYHAWTYDLDGSLRAAPRSDREPGFDTHAHPLLRVRLETIGPLVFIAADDRAPAFEQFSGEFAAVLREQRVPLDSCTFRARRQYDLSCNWKVYVDNALECYHCPVAHPGLSARVDVRPDAYRLEPRDWFSVQLSRRRSQDRQSSAQSDWDFQFYYLWPNTFLGTATGAASYAVHRIDPLDLERCRLTVEYYFTPDTDEQSAQDEIQLNDATLHEDTALVESVQRGLRSRALPGGCLLGSSEALVAHFQMLVRRALTREPGANDQRTGMRRGMDPDA
jgi:phenylpropionate dioxygenase-like ring-hydroxylating dioxygenase large terminal subunit